MWDWDQCQYLSNCPPNPLLAQYWPQLVISWLLFDYWRGRYTVSQILSQALILRLQSLVVKMQSFYCQSSSYMWPTLRNNQNYTCQTWHTLQKMADELCTWWSDHWLQDVEVMLLNSAPWMHPGQMLVRRQKVVEGLSTPWKKKEMKVKPVYDGHSDVQ